MDRVARVGRQDDVAGAGDGLGEVGQPLLGAERDDGLALRVQLDAEAARVVGAERAAQAGDAARGRVAVRPRSGQGLRQLLDDVLRRRLVGIAHADVDYVLAGGARLGLQGADLGKNMRGKAIYASGGLESTSGRERE